MGIFATVALSAFFKPRSLYTPPKLFTTRKSSKKDFTTPNLNCKVPKLIGTGNNKDIYENNNTFDTIMCQNIRATVKCRPKICVALIIIFNP